MFQSNFPYANTGIQLALKLSNPSLFGQPSGTWKKHQRTYEMNKWRSALSEMTWDSTDYVGKHMR